MEPIATEKQWHRLGNWGQAVPAPELHKLLNTARSDNLPALTEQIASARLKWKPEPDVDDTIVKAMSILEQADEVNSVLVTDGEEKDQSGPSPQEIEKAVNVALAKAMGPFSAQVADMQAETQKSCLSMMKQTMEALSVAKAAVSPMFPNATLQVQEAKMKMPDDAELYQRGTFEGVKQAIIDGISQIKITTPVQNVNHVAPAVVKMEDARPLVFPELQIIPRLLEALTGAVIELQRAVTEFAKPKKPVAFTMEKQKDGSWKVRGQ